MTVDLDTKPKSCPFQASKPLFTPPYPIPHKNKNSLFKRFFMGQISWLHTLFEKSYTMKMGEVKLPKLNFFIVNETNLVKDIMVKNIFQFPKHRLFEELVEPVVGQSIFTVSGKEWEKQRQMVYPAFTHTNLRRSFALMQDATKDLIIEIKKQIETNNSVFIDPLMTFVTADIIYRTLFSMKITQEEADKIYYAFADYQSIIQPCSVLKIYGLPTWYHRRKINKATAKIHAVFSPIVKKRYDDYHNNQKAGDDILGSLLQAKNAETDEHFSLQELIDQVSLVFFAGHETSASALTWALYLLAETPDIQKKCRNQITKNDFDHADLKDFTELTNVFDETLRLYPPIAFFLREASCPVKMREKNIAAGSMITISPWLIHRNPNEWPQPHEFNPDRFNDSDNDHAKKEAYLPFGKGPRTCIGAGFAKQESLIVLAHILQNFKLTYTEKNKPNPVGRVTVRPQDGIYLNVRQITS